MIQISRFPFLFWGMRKEPEAYFDGQHIIKGENTYDTKKASMIVYILFKYFLIFIGLFIIFTKHDFMPSVDKFIQYGVALVISFLVLVLPKKYIIWLIVVLGIGIFVALFFGELYFISFIFKYAITFFILLSLLIDFKKEHYYILKNNKIVANAIIGGE